MLAPGPPIIRLVQAALANECIRSYLADPELAGIWTVEGVTRHPTVRVVYEHAKVIGGSGKSLAAAKHTLHPCVTALTLNPRHYVYKHSRGFFRIFLDGKNLIRETAKQRQ